MTHAAALTTIVMCQSNVPIHPPPRPKEATVGESAAVIDWAAIRARLEQKKITDGESKNC